MLAVRTNGAGEPALVLMHFLGGSAREWLEVVAELGNDVRTVAIDLPGFGDSAEVGGYSVAEMADAVAETVGTLGLKRFVLVGHSLSGKVAAVLASRGMAGLEALVLVAPSPLSPEPMAGSKRDEMVAALGTVREGDRERARSYVTKNELRKLEPAVLERATDDVQRMNRAAWVAWVEEGSREDWTDRVGSIMVPTLFVVGEEDSSLGLAVQREMSLPRFSSARIQVVPECGHLVPLERPLELATILREFLAQIAVPARYLEFIHSERVSAKTREVLLERLGPRKASNSFNPHQIATLRAVVARVLPQPELGAIDLTGFIVERLESGQGDGWRYAVLPPDCEAYYASLRELDELAVLLHELPFTALTEDGQDAILHQIATRGPVEAPHLFRWFEDVRADAAQAWMAHPRTLARIGYSGIGIGGATTPEAGFVTLGPGAVEPWEPEAERQV